MKRIAYLLFVLILFVGITSCEDKDVIKGPQISTLSADQSSYGVVILTGCVKGLDGVALDFECGIEYSTDGEFSTNNTTRQKVDKNYSEEPFSIKIACGAGTQYYFRAYYLNSGLIYYGEVKSFTFVWDAPKLTTINAVLDPSGVVIFKGVIENLSNIIKENRENSPWDFGYAYSFNYIGIEYSQTNDFKGSLRGSVSPSSYDYNTMGDTIICYLYDFEYGKTYYYRTYFEYYGTSARGEIKTFKFDWAPQFVDLGLSVNWATCNVGAQLPNDYGNYYAWGEIETKTSYTWTNYKYRSYGDNYDNAQLNKYNTSNNYGTPDYKIVLEQEDDAAHVLWGGNWRMPSAVEFQELKDNCTWSWSTHNGVPGFYITSKKAGYTDRCIFLPATGYYNESKGQYVGHECHYWTNALYSLDSRASMILYSMGGSLFHLDKYQRSSGRAVRPVCYSETWAENVSLSIENESISVVICNSANINATAIKGNEDVSNLITWSSNKPYVATVDDSGVVNAISDGEAIITASIAGLKKTCVVKVTKCIDLGLSVKWAAFNIGATKPEEYGDYFAWGETTTKDRYSEDNYTYYHYTEQYSYQHILTKYCTKEVYGYNDIVDNKTTLDITDDAAYVIWGEEWRMPTQQEFQELIDNCTWTWATVNGVKGYVVTSKKTGYTDRSLFLPNTGYLRDSSSGQIGSYGHYWTSTLDVDIPCDAYNLHTDNSQVKVDISNKRYTGHTIRPVCP